MEQKRDTDPRFMTARRLQTELLRCEYCEEKPCQKACPANCSPFDFIMAARVGNPSDLQRSAGEIMRNNPLGGICGLVCPDRFCMAACSRKDFDGPINIPQVQATIVHMAKELGGIPRFQAPALNGRKIAVIGGGPAGLGAATALAQLGYEVDVYEARDKLGGMLNLIPDHRLDKEVVRSDIDFALSLGAIHVQTGTPVSDPAQLLDKGYDAVCVTAGLWKPLELGIENEDLAIKMADLLSNPERLQLRWPRGCDRRRRHRGGLRHHRQAARRAARGVVYAREALGDAADTGRAPGVGRLRHRD